MGAIEALLLRVEPAGWIVAGGTIWRRIRKFKVGAALGRDNHGDIHSIAGLVNEAFEAACEVVAFTRDVDADRDRADAIARGIAFATTIFPTVAIIGGPAIPAIEGWIVALFGVRDTEDMSRDHANRELAACDLGGKHAEDYCDVIANADLAALPPGSDALRAWIKTADDVLARAIRGAPVP